jgi:hypothetical protein
MGLARFEQKLERLVEGTVARAFRSGLQPIELGKHITRQMDLERQIGPRGLIAPNVFEIYISDYDAKRFDAFAGELENELEDTVRQHARQEGYQLVGSVSVKIIADSKLKPSTVDMACQVRSDPDGLPAAHVILPDGRRVKVGADPITIGRLPECDITLYDRNVSRRHAEIRRAGNDVVLVDLGSTNGTKVNGAFISRHRLSDKDEITLGSVTLFFEVG